MSVIKQEEKEKSRQRILNSAIKLFAQKGYDGVGIREICKDANANICMISYFWGGKEGLYKGIIDSLVEKQTQIAKTFVNLDIEPNTLNKKEQINLLFKIFDNMVDFIYGNEFSHHIIRVLISAQHEKRVELTSPLLVYIRELIASIFDKDIISISFLSNLSFFNCPSENAGITSAEFNWAIKNKNLYVTSLSLMSLSNILAISSLI